MTKSINRNQFIWTTFFFLFVILTEWLIGSFININEVVLITYLAYLMFIYVIDTRFFITFAWIIAMQTLNIMGVYVCDSIDLYLTELFFNTHFNNALAPLVFSYTIFFGVLELSYAKYRAKKQIKATMETYYMHSRIRMKLISILSIALVAALFFQVIRTPAYLMGVNRAVFSETYLTSIERRLKSKLILLLPILIIYSKEYGKKMCTIVFTALFLFYCFWCGEKFGPFFSIGYLFLIGTSADIDKKKMNRFLLVLLILAGLLMAVVYLQRTMLNGDNNSLFKQYLFQRLAQQGQVWWSVYGRQNGQSLHLGELWDELSAVLPIKTDNLIGQWKMMVEASDSPIVRSRAIAHSPYTATTAASVFYYFRYIGLVVLYWFFGIVYSKIISSISDAFQYRRIVEAVLLERIVLLFHDLINASDLYIVSVKGAFYIFAFLAVVYLRKIRIGITVGNRRLL